MKIVVQRVKDAKVKVHDLIVSQIDFGFLLLVGFTLDDNEEKLSKMAKKIINLRIFSDENGKLNKNIKDVLGEILIVSQFTLYANTNHGNRPSFTASLNSNDAKVLYEKFVNIFKNDYQIKTRTGVFQEHMDISFTNDGPVTIILEN